MNIIKEQPARLKFKRKHRWFKSIICKLSAEKATSLNDSELNRCLSRCVAGPKLIKLAKKYRESGLLKYNMLFKINY